MSVGDAELLAACRSGAQPPASVWAAVAALRDMAATGEAATVGGIERRTGYDRATVYRARTWLDENIAGWKEPAPAPVVRPVVEVVEVVGVDEPTPEPETTPAITPPKTSGPPCLTWRDALDKAHQAVAGRRTWDLFADIYSPTADALFAAGSIGDLIALTVNYVETVSGGKVTAAERKRIAQVVRIHGKAVIYGMQEALARVDAVGNGPIINYAVAVARSTHRTIRDREAATP